MEEKDKFWSLIFIILGIGLMLWGAKDFILPTIAAILGFMLANYGLSLRNKPPLIETLKRWFSELR